MIVDDDSDDRTDLHLELLALPVGERRRSSYVEQQFDAGCGLVCVLATRTSGRAEAPRELRFRYDQIGLNNHIAVGRHGNDGSGRRPRGVGVIVPLVSSPPVVLVHGLATSSTKTWVETGWVDLIQDAGRTAIAADLMGHGSAPKPTDPDAYAELENQLLGQFPDGPVDAIGFSLGARTLLALACEHPGRFNKLVLAGVGRNLFERDDERGKAIADAIGGKPDPTNREAAYFDRLADDPEIDRGALSALLRRPPPAPFTDEGLALVTMPVLIAIGDQDFAGPADILVEKLPNATHKVLRKVDHFATPENFDFIDAALNFLLSDTEHADVIS